MLGMCGWGAWESAKLRRRRLTGCEGRGVVGLGWVGLGCVVLCCVVLCCVVLCCVVLCCVVLCCVVLCCVVKRWRARCGIEDEEKVFPAGSWEVE